MLPSTSKALVLAGPPKQSGKVWIQNKFRNNSFYCWWFTIPVRQSSRRQQIQVQLRAKVCTGSNFINNPWLTRFQCCGVLWSSILHCSEFSFYSNFTFRRNKPVFTNKKTLFFPWRHFYHCLKCMFILYGILGYTQLI